MTASRRAPSPATVAETYVGGKRGHVEHRHSYTVRDGVMVHTAPFTATMGINAASPYERTERLPGRAPWEVMPY